MQNSLILIQPLKKKSTKIIQIIRVRDAIVCGLGEDNMVYRWEELNSKWHLFGEIDDQTWEELK